MSGKGLDIAAPDLRKQLEKALEAHSALAEAYDKLVHENESLQQKLAEVQTVIRNNAKLTIPYNIAKYFGESNTKSFRENSSAFAKSFSKTSHMLFHMTSSTKGAILIVLGSF